jgi:cation/acetate symporter
MPNGTGLLLPTLTAILLIAAAAAVLSRSNKAVAQASGGAAFGPLGGGLAFAGLFAFAVTVLLPGLVHQHGFDGLIPFTGLTGGILLVAVLVGPALARSGAATLPELVGQRFGRFARALVLVVAFAATGGLLLGALSAGISITARLFDVSTATAALAASTAILALVLPGGLKSALGSSRPITALVGIALLGCVAILSFALFANPLAHLAYGAALRNITAAELSLIESGAVDFGIFKPFLREFLTVDRLNWALLTLCLMGAIAALPPLIQATGAFKPAATRRGLAWALTFVVVSLTAVPALAALARLETYRVISSGPTFIDLPDWVRRGSETGAISLHGTSLGLVDTVTQDVAVGASSIDAVSTAMSDRGTRSETRWQRLDPAVQASVLELARKFQASPSRSLADRWTAYVDTVVTAAAAAAGNMSGKPDLASIAMEPQDLLLALPHTAGLPPIVSSLVIAIALSAAAVLAATLIATLSSMLVRDGTATIFGREPGNTAEVALIRIAAVILTLGFALTAAVVPVAADVTFVVSLSLAAAGLLPALILAIWIPRANSWGLAAAMIAGLALGTYYLAGTALYSVSFYETWYRLSSAGPDAYADYEMARDIWIAAEGDDRAAAYADLTTRTTGSLWSPGLANWFGIAPAAAPILAVPFALLIGLLVSVITPRPRAAALSAFDRIHGRTRATATVAP